MTTVDFRDHTILAPLTKGGNLPFRRLCVDLGAEITTSEMAYARQVCRRSRAELALLRRHESEPCFGVQIAASKPDDAVSAGKMAVDRGAAFVDVNAGCPIHDTVRRGMGATLLKRPRSLVKIIEAMASTLPVPVTAKLRTGWSEGEFVALQLARDLQEAGAAAITLHARSREQRYTKAADWDRVADLVTALDIPVIGNGDVLTYYEARARRAQSGCAAVMVGRGALIKPWIFKEMREGRSHDPGAEERVALFRRLTGYFKEHFREDEKGRERTMRFLPWHFDFLCRYRPLPEERWAEHADRHPLLQTRLPDDPEVSLLEAVLRDPRPEMHAAIADALWESVSDQDAVARITALGEALPPITGEAEGIATSHG